MSRRAEPVLGFGLRPSFAFRHSLFGFLLLSYLLSPLSYLPVFAQPTAFTYQGRLDSNGAAFTGSAEFQFTLWDADSGGTVVATNDPPQFIAPVSNGLFSVELDFGGDVFDGSERFLQIQVRTTIGPFATLSPRQTITPAPQAIHAATASTAVEAMTVDMGSIINPSFIGTTATNAPLELFVNNLRALRLEDSGGDSNNDGTPDGAPNVIGGAPVNSVAPDILGATISGGGATALTGSPEPNTVDGDYGTVGGGLGNTAGTQAVVGGGRGNDALGSRAVVGGGLNNDASGQETTIGGGFDNTASGTQSAIAGGGQNVAGGSTSAIGGGSGNMATGHYSALPGGLGNTASGNYSAVGGGSGNTASEGYSTVAGGLGCTASGFYSIVAGGSLNTAQGAFSFAAGRHAQANDRGTFVWADSADPDFVSDRPDEFAIRAANGVRIHNIGSGRTLLRLESDRPWEFRQRNSGASTALELVSLDVNGTANKNFIVNTTGRVGIGTTAPAFTLHVDGSAGKPGGGSWSSASDARLKDVGAPFTRGLASLEKIQPRHYRYSGDNPLNLPSDRDYVGLIAQDVQAAIPEAIEPNDTGYLHVNNDPILWTMLNGIKELNRKVDDRSQKSEIRSRKSKTSIEKLRAENAELKARLEKLERLVQSLTH